MKATEEPPPGIGNGPYREGKDDLMRRVAELTEAVAARDTFIAVAAHELRNPMTPILGQIDLLLSGVRAARLSPERIEQKLENIQYIVRRYMRRGAVLLDVSRITTRKLRLEPVSCDLVALLRAVVEEFAETARHAGVAIEVDTPESLPGSWDTLAVEQVIDNLVSNAIKYGGRTPVEATATACGDRVRIQVRDHGNGVPATDRARVFQRFERAVGQNQHRSGFGVGLWVAGQLVEAMQGTIAIDDAPGGGALFTVTLPLCAEANEQ